jgi:hypothetical protein
MLRLAIVGALALLSAACASARPALEIDFVPQSERFAPAAAQYEGIWSEDGGRIVRTMEAKTGLRFEPGPITAVVFEGVSRSGYGKIPMHLRASYPEPTKRATLIHELGHRLLSTLEVRDFEDHPILFLFLYDVWAELYGRAFADEQVAVESGRKGIYDYAGAWRTALAMSAEERAAALAAFVRERAPSPRR